MRIERCPLCGSIPLQTFCTSRRRYLDTAYELEVVRCAHCGFKALAEEPAISYDSSYLEHELVLTTADPIADLKCRERIAGISRHCAPGPEVRLLDVGIGDGRLLHFAEQRGYSTFGLDINDEGVRAARLKFGLRADLSLDSLEHSFPGISFNVIHMSEVIEHLRDPIDMLRQLKGRLVPGGLLVVQTGNVNSVVARIKGSEWEYIRPMHVSYFSTSTLARALDISGFKVDTIKTLEWRWLSVFEESWRLSRSASLAAAASLLILKLTASVHGIRRGMVAYARA